MNGDAINGDRDDIAFQKGLARSLVTDEKAIRDTSIQSLIAYIKTKNKFEELEMEKVSNTILMID